MSNKSNLYIGRAGQLAVMSEFLLRGWNAALPEVDVGDDVFVVKDKGGDLFRIQARPPDRTPWVGRTHTKSATPDQTSKN